jgi:hypothetical protein
MRQGTRAFIVYDPKWAANPAGGLPEPQYEGQVHAFDLSDLSPLPRPAMR